MNFTNSPYEKMMKEIPARAVAAADRCAGCRHLKECGNRKDRCRKSFASRAKLARSPDSAGN